MGELRALTGRIIGCAMAVHSGLGNGFREIIYQSALEMEMEDAGICFSREHEMPVFYKGRQIGLRRVDFLVEDVICVELKAVVELTDAHLAQAKNYLEAYDLNVGLLINFGAKSLEFKRAYNRKFKQQTQGNPSIPSSRQSR
ncbi:MAG: GxxExxY protein [Gemmatimonadetes bacterium]|nr:GxxExxY protein [Gemmatimonadota bacterium]MDE3257851.1 GxxExxY protein [Gemmatimonadota bacterium]